MPENVTNAPLITGTTSPGEELACWLERSYQLAALFRAGVLQARESHHHGHAHHQAQESAE